MYPRPLHKKLFERQNGKCYYCRAPMVLARPSEHPLRACTLDHRRAKSCGGSGHEENLVGACAECNGLKGHLSDSVFLFLIAEAQGDKQRLRNLCVLQMYPNCRLAKRKGGHWPTRRETELDRAWSNIMSARHAAVAQQVEARS